MNKATYSVWVGGTEVNDYHLTEKEAVAIKAAWELQGYTDVTIKNKEESLVHTTKTPSVSMNEFVKRQTKDSSFSHWEISDEELISRVKASLSQGRKGYREGVLLVSVDPSGFFSSVVTLKDGDTLLGDFKPRKIGENPRKSIRVKGNKIPAQSAEIVLYAHGVLKENGENNSDDDWEIISVNASPTKGDTPILPDTLMANHFGLSGGTVTTMTNDQFVDALKASFLYWQDKALSV